MTYKRFKYNVVELIEYVRDRPCLWDKTLEIYKDRLERRAAWEEIFVAFEGGYDAMTAEEKRILGEQIMTKWTNVKDTFIKTLKTRMGRRKKKYLFYDQLKFLTKITPEEEVYSAEILNAEVYTGDEGTSMECMKPETQDAGTSGPSKSRKRSKKSACHEIIEEYIVTPSKVASVVDGNGDADGEGDGDSDANLYNDIDFIECDEDAASRVNDLRLMNEDEAFFASLLPTIVKYSEDERLDFRIQVLGVMKNIKRNRSSAT